MRNTFGNNVMVTIFGEIDGIEPGLIIDEDFIASRMDKRRASGSISTSRREDDKVNIVSGVYNGMTTGTPITFIIYNQNKKSADYDKLASVCRPGHSDYTGYF